MSLDTSSRSSYAGMEMFSRDKANDRRFERGLKILLDGFEKKLS